MIRWFPQLYNIYIMNFCFNRCLLVKVQKQKRKLFPPPAGTISNVIVIVFFFFENQFRKKPISSFSMWFINYCNKGIFLHLNLCCSVQRHYESNLWMPMWLGCPNNTPNNLYLSFIPNRLLCNLTNSSRNFPMYSFLQEWRVDNMPKNCNC